MIELIKDNPLTKWYISKREIFALLWSGNQQPMYWQVTTDTRPVNIVIYDEENIDWYRSLHINDFSNHSLDFDEQRGIADIISNFLRSTIMVRDLVVLSFRQPWWVTTESHICRVE